MIPTWTLGDRLAKAREGANISVTEMARRLRVSRTTISNYEHNRTDPTVSTLMAYEHYTGVPTWWLLGDGEPTDDAVTGGYPPTRPITLAA